MEKKFLTLASALTFASLLSFNAYADMDLETNNAVSGMAVALNNYKASSISPQTALAESLKTATTKTIEINGNDGAGAKLVKEAVRYEAPTIQDKLKENIAVANSNNVTTVRASAEDNGEKVGSITYSSVATVLETVENESGEWYKISSGNVDGYVKASEVATGEEAKKIANETAVRYATVVDISNVRLRTKPKVTADTLTMLEEGERYLMVGQDNDFVKLQVDDDLVGYVYKDFVTTDVTYPTAKTDKEIEVEAFEKEKLKKEADDAMAKYENLVIADNDKASPIKGSYSVIDETTAEKTVQTTVPLVTEQAIIVKSPGDEGRVTSETSETKDRVKAKEETIKITETAKAELQGPGEIKKETVVTIESTSTAETKKVESTTETQTVRPVESTTAAETVKPTESGAAQTVAPIESTTGAQTVGPTAAETVKPAESTTAAQTVGPTESGAEAQTVGPTAAETVKPTESTTAAQTVGSTEGTTAAETVKPTESTTTARETEIVGPISTQEDTGTVEAPSIAESTVETTKAEEIIESVQSTKRGEKIAGGPGGEEDETVQKTVAEETVKVPETAKFIVEETTRILVENGTRSDEKASTKPSESIVESETDNGIRAYGPGGSTEKPKETQAKTTAASESSIVTGVNGGPGVSKSNKAKETTKAAVEKASRSAIVAYAKQFVGNPYVYGGTSLTNGADCSGFTMRVYEHFGISTGRNTKQQARNGREIPISEVEIGDLIFYANSGEIGHVGIYIGDGKIVHAANSKSGIIISSRNYRTPVKAVTFLR